MTSWREIIEPRWEVSSGEYQQAAFAADLLAVVRGTAAPGYLDAEEFFAQTYMTAGIEDLLRQALRRIMKGEGAPVIQLETSFGGGKTHSMIALYHLFSGKKIAQLQSLLDSLEIRENPAAHVAAVVGTDFSPIGGQVTKDFTVHTLWGEIAAQLADSAGKHELYDVYIKNFDERGAAPTVGVLRDFLNECGSCLILLDELVAYGKNLYDVKNRDPFDKLTVFVQNLSEAVTQSKSSMAIVTLPMSKMEIGDGAGWKVYETVKHYFRGLQAVKSMAAADEGFHIVRCRLFDRCKDTAALDEVCAEFSEMYSQNASDFPSETRRQEYLERLKDCYPIHPALFDYLYQRWAALPNFQSTRGVLSLMAKVIHVLWRRQDSSSMIMPATIPLENSEVQEILFSYLPKEWRAVVSADVEGKNSEAKKLDARQNRFGKIKAAESVARTIFLGSAPTVSGMSLRGLNEENIRLGAVVPTQASEISVFNDALKQLRETSSYMYSGEQNYWYDTLPSLRKLAEKRAEKISDDDVTNEIERRLKNLRGTKSFERPHFYTSPSDVPDKDFVRLVILPPNSPHEQYNSGKTAAIEAALECLDNGRKFRNMLLFLAADSGKIRPLKDEVRSYLAWLNLQSDREINFDKTQTREMSATIDGLDKKIGDLLALTYCWALSPKIVDKDRIITTFDANEIKNAGDNIIDAAEEIFVNSDKLVTDSLDVEYFALDLDDFDLLNGSNEILISDLWDYYARNCYLSRLFNADVLCRTIEAGVAEKKFALADSGKEGEYVGLSFGGRALTYKYLVKGDAAQEILNRPKPTPEPETVAPTETFTSEPASDTSEPEIFEWKFVRNFRMAQKLDAARMSEETREYYDKILSRLVNLPDAEVKIILSVDICVPCGIDSETVESVRESCGELGVSGKFE